MQWRSLVIGLVVLRLSVSCVLWLAFGLERSVSLDVIRPRAERPSGDEGSTGSTCARGEGEPPTRSYPSFFDGHKDDYVRRYSSFSGALKEAMREKARGMFYFGYDNYMKYAFPKDELNPIDCEGRGPDVQNPSNVNINDVLGNYSLTLIDSLDTLLVLGNVTEFQSAVKLVIDTVSFDKDSTVQVFEANIRILGSLISAHILLTDTKHPFGRVGFEGYDNQLLHLAHDLAVRLLPAFENTSTGIPYPRVNLKTGVPSGSINETCPAGAGSLLVEFGILSRLTGDFTFESVARRAVRSLWKLRSNQTGLLGKAPAHRLATSFPSHSLTPRFAACVCSYMPTAHKTFPELSMAAFLGHILFCCIWEKAAHLSWNCPLIHPKGCRQIQT